MAEGGGDNRPRISEGQRIGRRGFVQGLAATGIASGAGTVAAAEAPRIREARFETPLAYYDPHYEFHLGSPLTADDLPSNINIFSRESVSRDRSHRSNAEALRQVVEVKLQEPRRAFPDDVIEKVAANHGFLMLEDSVFPFELTVPGAAIDVAAAGKGLSMIVNEYKSHRGEPGTQILNRRQVSKAGVGLLAWGVSGGAGAVAAGAGIAGSESLERVASRVNAIQSKLHPELAIALFRDALMAEKMSAVAEEFGKTYGHRPHISYVAGYAHTGMEDFLRHPDLARMVIAGYPQEVLSRAVEGNNGTQQFSTTSLYQVDSPSTGIPLQERIEQARRFDVVDRKLERLVDRYLITP